MNPLVRRSVYTVAVLLLGVYGYFTLRGPQGLPALLGTQREIHQLEEQNANLARENESKRERIRKLRGSQSEQDLEIRKKLKMLHPDETEFILPSASKTSPAQ